MLIVFALLSAVSVVWSVSTGASWQDAGRMSPTAPFRRGDRARAARPRCAGRRSSAGSRSAAVTVCGYALLTKVFPAQLDANDAYARLQEPYGYWNAIGLTAAMG